LHRYEACGDNCESALKERITELLYRGPLLTEMNLEWLDSFKDSYSSKSLDLLLRMLQSGTGCVSESDITRLASVMFMYDPLSEKALAACCAVLIKHDKRSIAKNVFDRFCDDYLDAMGEPFSVPFTSLIDNR
jgi:DNA-binding SARP family transcriptional activator